MESSSSRTPSIKDRIRKNLPVAAIAGAAALTAAVVLPHVPARAPSPDEDCKGKVDGIERVDDRWMDQYDRFKISRLSGQAACTNVYLNVNRTSNGNGSHLRGGELSIGDDWSFCYNPEFPDQLQMERKRHTFSNVEITPQLQKDIQTGSQPVPKC